METVIQTIDGTFIVPVHKHSALISWLQSNAIKAGQQSIQEQGTNHLPPEYRAYTGTQLISE